MRLLARLVAAAGLVVAGGLTLPGGAAQASACSGTTGVTVVIDNGARTTTSCAPESSSAMAALRAVAGVTPVQTQPGFICKINSYPDTACVRTPPASAYWAFFHASRGGSWIYSSTGAGSYDPPSGGVIGFAFGSGGAPSSAPPPASAPPKPKPSPRSSSTPPAPKPPATSPRPSGQASPTKVPGGTSTDTGATSTTPGARPTTSTSPNATTSTTTGSATPAPGTSDGTVAASSPARSDDTGDGSPTTLLAGLGLVGLVGSAAAYLGLRRRGDS